MQMRLQTRAFRLVEGFLRERDEQPDGASLLKKEFVGEAVGEFEEGPVGVVEAGDVHVEEGVVGVEEEVRQESFRLDVRMAYLVQTAALYRLRRRIVLNLIFVILLFLLVILLLRLLRLHLIDHNPLPVFHLAIHGHLKVDALL